MTRDRGWAWLRPSNSRILEAIPPWGVQMRHQPWPALVAAGRHHEPEAQLCRFTHQSC